MRRRRITYEHDEKSEGKRRKARKTALSKSADYRHERMKGEECESKSRSFSSCCFLPAAEDVLNVLQTPQADLEHAGAAILARSEACEFGGRVCLSVSKGTDKHAGEMVLPLFVGGGSRDREKCEQQAAEGERTSGCQPHASASLRT